MFVDRTQVTFSITEILCGDLCPLSAVLCGTGGESLPASWPPFVRPVGRRKERIADRSTL